jgi:O-antigen/teichoic acid export membrane protein
MLKLLKNFSYTISSNLLNFVVIALVTLIVPKLIGVKDYGFWQLYLFYTNYVGILHFGWIDGIYLKYGGVEYSKLDPNYFKTQFFYFSIFQVIIAVSIATLGIFQTDNDSKFVVMSIAICLIFYNLRQFFLYILQDTNRIRDYAFNIISDRIIYSLWIVVFLAFGIRNYKLFIVGDIVSKMATLFMAMVLCKNILFGKILKFTSVIDGIYDNIRIGIKLLSANLASLLIIGIVRYGIKNEWGVAIFGKVSLTLSISNAMMLFVTAVSLVLFPMLRRIDKSLLNRLYGNFRYVLIYILFICMFLYFPMITIMDKWLPNYQSSLKYLAFLFPMLVYEGKFELMVNTFLKTLRMEKTLLVINLIALVTSTVVTIIDVILVKNLNVTMLSIIIILWFRSNLGEAIVCQKIKLKVIKNMVVETAVITIFIYTTWWYSDMTSLIIYFLMFIIYSFLYKNKVKKGIKFISRVL